MGTRKSFFDIVFKGGELLAAAAFVLLCVTVSIQVISRYVFNVAFGWGEELPIFVFLWVSFIAASVAYREGNHLSVDFIADRFPRSWQKPITYINLILCLLFIIALFYYEGTMTLLVRESTFVVMKISKAYCYVGIPLSCLIFAVFIIEKIIRTAKSKTELTAAE